LIIPYIDFDTELYDFGKDLFTLTNNPYFGKTEVCEIECEIAKNNVFVSYARKCVKLIAKSQLKSFKALIENTVLINCINETVLLDEPIYMPYIAFRTCREY